MVNGSIHKRKRRIPGATPAPELPKTDWSTTQKPLPKQAVCDLTHIEIPKVMEKPKQRNTFVSNGTTWHRTETGWSCYDPEFDINHSQLNFLTHSYLYYVLDTSLISDDFYDRSCKHLYEKQQKYPEVFEKSEFYELCKPLDASGSGFYLKEEDYPTKILQVAKRLIIQHNREVPKKLEGVEPYEGRKNTK